MSYFANLRLTRVVIHEIYQREVDGGLKTPRFNDVISHLDREALETLQIRIVNALGDNSHSIEMDIVKDDDTSIFQKGAKLLRAQDTEFIDVSKEITQRLAENQTTRNIPRGIVLIFSGTTGSNNFPIWGIIKADFQEGFMKQIETEVLKLKYITDLLLTPQQKLYKLAVLIEIANTANMNESRLKEEFKAFVYDHNMTRNESQQAALYFYRDFLGCTYSPTDKKLTQDFYLNTKEYIKTSDLDADKKNELATALFTYMKVSQEKIVHVESFAEEFFPEDEKPKYVEYMDSKSFPQHAISKDLTYLKNRLRQRKVRFSNNVKIIAPADNFSSLLEITSDYENNETVVKIHGVQIPD